MSPVLYFALSACAVCACLLLYRHDLYDREPPAVMLLVAVLGVFAMWTAGKVETVIFTMAEVDSGYVMAAVAAVVEEALKLSVVAAVAICLSKHFNDPMDGLVYGAVSGLGMALEESVYYMRLFSPETVLPATELVRLLGHLVMGGIGGFAVSAAVFRLGHWVFAFIASITAAVGLHFAWDWISLAAPADEFRSTDSVLAAALMFGGLVIYATLVTKASRHSRDLFAPLSEDRLWGWPFTQ
jgi:RsiW-degrading membrane proteinase PrsW (M82 family)